jgi:hypothetical protein
LRAAVPVDGEALNVKGLAELLPAKNAVTVIPPEAGD